MVQRITDLGLANQRARWIQEGRSTAAAREQDLATGRVVTKASDDPGASARLMRHDTRLKRIEQYRRNTDNAMLWVNTADAALQAASNNLGRAKTLAVQAGNELLGQVERDALAADIRAVGGELLAVANTTASGRAVFAGTANTNQAFDAAGLYLGDSGVVVRAIDTDETVDVGYDGEQVFGTSNPGSPMNGSVFEVLEALAAAVETGDIATVRTGITAVNDATARVGQAQGRVGAVANQLDAANLRHGDEQLAVETFVSEIRDTDVADAIIRLRSAEASYQATLSATARGISSSLLDFLS